MTERVERVAALVDAMRGAIDAFEANGLTIVRLSWELKSRIAALEEDADPTLVQRLRTIRNQVEVVSAFFIESGRSALTEEERIEAQRALDDMKLVLERVDSDA